MRIFAFAALLLLAASPASAQMRAVPDAKGSFSIDLPQNAEDRVAEAPRVEGVTTRHLYSTRDDGKLFIFVVSDYDNPQSPEIELAADVDTFIKGVNAKTQSMHGVYFRSDRGQILPAMEFAATSDAATYQGLFVMDRNRVYSLTEGVDKATSDKLDFEAWKATFHVLDHPH